MKEAKWAPDSNRHSCCAQPRPPNFKIIRGNSVDVSSSFIIPQQMQLTIARTLGLSLILAQAFAAPSCKRGEFRKFDSPAIVVFLQPTATLDLLEDAKTSERPFGKIGDQDDPEAVGVLQLAAASFLQIKCPSRIHCDGGLGYIQKDFVAKNASEVNEKSIAYLLDLNESLDGGLDRTKKTREWLANPGLEIPMRPDQGMIEAQLNLISNADDRLVRTIELSRVFSGIADPSSLKDTNLPIVVRYAVLRKIVSTRADKPAAASEGDASASTEPAASVSPVSAKELKKINNNLNSRAEDQLQKMLEGFAFRDQNWVGLAREFNKLSAAANLPDYVLARILENGEYLVDPALPDGATTKTAEWRIDVKPLEGVFLNAKIKPEFADATTSEKKSQKGEANQGSGQASNQTSDQVNEKMDKPDREKKDERIRLISTKAVANSNGLAMELKTSRGVFKIKPKEVPPFLAKGGPGLATLISRIPADWQKIQSENGFARATVLTALKFGIPDGDMDTSTGQPQRSPYSKGNLSYILDTNDWHYWMMFSLVKMSPHITVEGQGFNGKFNVGDGSLYQMGSAVEAWYQPKGEFKIQHRYIGGRGGQSALTETTCFSQNLSKFRVSLEPSEINKDHPKVSLELMENPGLCQIVIHGLNEEKSG